MDKQQAAQIYQQANSLYSKRDFKQALELLNQLNTVFPDNTNVVNARQRCLEEIAKSAPTQRFSLKKIGMIAVGVMAAITIATGVYSYTQKDNAISTSQTENITQNVQPNQTSYQPPQIPEQKAETVAAKPADDAPNIDKIVEKNIPEPTIKPVEKKAENNSIPGVEWKEDYGTGSEDYVFKAEAEIKKDPTSITLHWWNRNGKDPEQIIKYEIEAGKPLSEGKSHVLFDAKSSANAQDVLGSKTYEDKDVEIGKTYTYKIKRDIRKNDNDPNYDSKEIMQILLSGIEVPLVEDRGKLILVVEEKAKTLDDKLQQFMLDIAGDGYTVVEPIYVSRNDKPADVKKKIEAAYRKDPENTKSLILLGRVPVPYSGFLHRPDGHQDHQGVWPADTFYAEIEGTDWLDTKVTSVNKTGPGAEEHWSVPRDGKYDNIIIDSPLEMMFGRIDLSDMPSFGSETELLARYLDKVHRFKSAGIKVVKRGLIFDEFWESQGRAKLSLPAWDIASVVGINNTLYGRWSISTEEPFLFGFGAGSGSYHGAGRIAETEDLKNKEFKVAFMQLFGSYFIDWDNKDSFLRAHLCQPDYGLAVLRAQSIFVVTDDNWNIFLTSLGNPIGKGVSLQPDPLKPYDVDTKINRSFNVGMKDFVDYVNATNITNTLLGDPTLRIEYPAPVSGLEIKTSSEGTEVSWQPGVEDGVTEYRVYASNNKFGGFKPIGKTDSNTTTLTVKDDAKYFMVKAVKLSTSGSGSYYNASIGQIVEAKK